MNTKHTPGPLHVDAGRHGIYIRAGKPTDPLGGDLVAQAFNATNAAHIVQCVNSHDELLKALQDLTDAVLRFTNATPEDWPELSAALAARARAKAADRRIDGYNPEFLGAKPAKAGQDY